MTVAGSVDFDEFPAGAVWLQLEDETRAAYSAFCVYRNAGVRRSQRQACRDYYGLGDLPPTNRQGGSSTKLRQIQTWASLYEWRERVAAYDNHLDRMAQIANLDRLKANYELEATLGAAMLGRAAARIVAIDLDTMSVPESIRMLDLGVRHERIAREDLRRLNDVVAATSRGDRAVMDRIRSDPALAELARNLAVALSEGQVDPEPDP